MTKNDEPSLEKLKMYKTAFSPLWNMFVEIKSVHTDDNGVPILITRLPTISDHFFFRPSELVDFSL